MSTAASDFFESAHQVFLSACDSTERSLLDYNLGGLVVSTEIAGSDIAEKLRPALAHLSLPQQTSRDLTICAWDGTAADMISPPWSKADYGPRGEIRGFNCERFQTMFDHGTNSLVMIDHDQARALFWTPRAAALPAYERGAPFRAILGWSLLHHDRLLVHAGAIFLADKGVLLAGAGGAGKSTTALICAANGARYLADDYCAVTPGDRPRVHSLYNSAKLSTSWLREVPQLQTFANHSTLRHEEKLLIFLQETAPHVLIRSAPLHVMLLPRVVGGNETTIERATSAQAMRALAPSSIFQTAGAGASAFHRLTGLVQNVPAYWLNLGRDTDRIAAQIRDCVSHLP